MKAQKIKLDGKGVELGEIDASGVAEALASLSLVIKKQASGSVDDKENFLAFSGVEKGCVAFLLTPSSNSMLKSLARVSRVMAGIDPQTRLNKESREELRNLIGICKRRKYQVSFPLNGKKGDRIMLDVEKVISIPETKYHQYPTKVFGELLDVGGLTPNAHIRTGGKSLTCELSGRKMAMELAKRLYQFVELEGEAVINMDTMEMVKFKAVSVGRYKDPVKKDALHSLRMLERKHGCFDGVDANEYVSSLRG